MRRGAHQQSDGGAGDHRHAAADKADGNDRFPAGADLVQLFIQRERKGHYRRLQQIAQDFAAGKITPQEIPVSRRNGIITTIATSSGLSSGNLKRAASLRARKRRSGLAVATTRFHASFFFSFLANHFTFAMHQMGAPAHHYKHHQRTDGAGDNDRPQLARSRSQYCITPTPIGTNSSAI